jgi:heterotetrameric sarcosine oxidase gamma subunit
MADALGGKLRDDTPVIVARPGAARFVLSLKSWARIPVSDTHALVHALELPTEVGRSSQGLPRVLTVGPGDWLLTYPLSDASCLKSLLATQLTSQGLVLVDLTPGIAVMEILGAQARHVLAKSCGLDFEPRLFRGGKCVRTRFAHIPVVIDCLQDGDVFELYAARSYGRYLRDWLRDASTEFLISSDPDGRSNVDS